MRRYLYTKFYYWYADTLLPFCGKLDALINRYKKKRPPLRSFPPDKAKLTFFITEEPATISCLVCGHTSYNTNDIKNHYCGYCHIFHAVPVDNDGKPIAVYIPGANYQYNTCYDENGNLII